MLNKGSRGREGLVEGGGTEQKERHGGDGT